MPLPAPQTRPESTGPDSAGRSRHMTVIYNDDHTLYDDVVEILIKATGCGRSEAEMETWEAHHLGKASVHFGTLSDCQAVASVIATIGMKVEVVAEWEEA